MGNLQNTPFSALGAAIRAMRLRAKESLVEVSAAIELPEERLGLIEKGELRPSEDIMELFIMHFTVQENEADKLWDLAGYDDKKSEAMHHTHEEANNGQQTVMVTPYDARIVYTDMVHVMVNNYGVIMNFMQGAGPNNQPLAVARVGMSREHAKSVLEVLQKTLDQAEEPPKDPKRLDYPNDKHTTK